MKRNRLAAAGASVVLAGALGAGIAYGGLSTAGADATVAVRNAAAVQSADPQQAPSTDPAAPDGAQGTPAAAPAGRPDPSARFQEILKPLVAAGTIDQSQADAVVKAIVDAGPPKGGPGHGGPGRGGPGRGMGLKAAATAIGITPEELRTQLQAGSTIADVARSKNVDPQKVIDAIVADLKAHEQAEVAAGKHTQAEVDQRLADATQRITDMVNGKMPLRGPGHDDRGPDQGPDGQDSSTTTTPAGN